jgi:hypothetical protein
MVLKLQLLSGVSRAGVTGWTVSGLSQLDDACCGDKIACMDHV